MFFFIIQMRRRGRSYGCYSSKEMVVMDQLPSLRLSRIQPEQQQQQKKKWQPELETETNMGTIFAVVKNHQKKITKERKKQQNRRADDVGMWRPLASANVALALHFSARRLQFSSCIFVFFYLLGSVAECHPDVPLSSAISHDDLTLAKSPAFHQQNRRNSFAHLHAPKLTDLSDQDKRFPFLGGSIR